jgi:hypothetical protein
MKKEKHLSKTQRTQAVWIFTGQRVLGRVDWRGSGYLFVKSLRIAANSFRISIARLKAANPSSEKEKEKKEESKEKGIVRTIIREGEGEGEGERGGKERYLFEQVESGCFVEFFSHETAEILAKL